jgi:ribonuclease/clavin/mitogillin
MNIVNVGYDSTNYYLLELGKAYLMVDAGWPGTLPKLENACRCKGVSLKQIAYVLVTHYHPDHAGLVQELKARGARLIVMESQVTAIGLMVRYIKPEQHFTEIDLRDNINLSFAESRDFLRKIGLQGQTIATPGHSDDSVTLVLDEGLAFTGDLSMPKSDNPEDPTRKSWARIRALGVNTVYPAHGPVRPMG